VRRCRYWRAAAVNRRRSSANASRVGAPARGPAQRPLTPFQLEDVPDRLLGTCPDKLELSLGRLGVRVGEQVGNPLEVVLQRAPQPSDSATRLADRVGRPDDGRHRDGHPRAKGGLPAARDSDRLRPLRGADIEHERDGDATWLLSGPSLTRNTMPAASERTSSSATRAVEGRSSWSRTRPRKTPAKTPRVRASETLTAESASPSSATSGTSTARPLRAACAATRRAFPRRSSSLPGAGRRGWAVTAGAQTATACGQSLVATTATTAERRQPRPGRRPLGSAAEPPRSAGQDRPRRCLQSGVDR
jgi:hypothetical protein